MQAVREENEALKQETELLKRKTAEQVSCLKRLLKKESFFYTYFVINHFFYCLFPSSQASSESIVEELQSK